MTARSSASKRADAARVSMVLAAVVVVGAATAARAYQGGAVIDGGAIAGTVRYAGTPPATATVRVTADPEVCGKERALGDIRVGKDGGLGNVVARLAGITKGKALEPSRDVTVDQRGCEYVPRVAVFPAGSRVRIQNSDGILHNVNTLAEANPTFNVAQPKFRRLVVKRIEEPEMPIKVRCDIHPWMRGWWVSQEHPYYALTDGDGRFQLTDVPAGTYDLELWHETLGTTRHAVAVQANQTARITLEMTKP
jgi:hypothetical protein